MHNFFNKFKFKYQKYAIKNLAMYVSILFAIGYLMLSTNVGYNIYFRYLAFYPREVLHGEIWRIVTAIIYPPSTGGALMAILGIFIYYNFATAVERTMGSFEFNVYFFGSFLIGELGNIVYFLISGVDAPFLPLFTHFSVFMAFAIMYAETMVLLFFFIPVKTKYLAIFELALYTYYFVVGGTYERIGIIAALIPIYLFYRMVYNGGGNIFSNIKNTFERRKRQRDWRDSWK